MDVAVAVLVLPKSSERLMRAACVLLIAAFSLTAAGCATTSGAPRLGGGERAARVGGVSAAISMLYEGRVDEARKALVKLLENDPADRRVRSLLQQIDMQPEALLGETSFRYRVRPGDTLSSLAQQHLGDPTMFYALARYNDLTLPVSLSPGSSLRIPGREKAPAPVRAAKPQPAVESTRAPPPKRAANPQRSAKLRLAGLEQLNRGNIDQAVTLLQQASASDPSDLLAKRDLERAIRIKRTVSRSQ